VRDYVRKTLAGEFDERLVYRKRLRRTLDDYERNVPPHVRRARWPMTTTPAGAPTPVPERRLDQLRDHPGRP
jgi:hypothetical protein